MSGAWPRPACCRRGTAGVVAGPALSAGATSSHQTIHVSTAKVANIGTVLTNGSGLTLYRYTEDPAGAATCTGACAKIWPPLLASKGAHIAGPKGVKGLSLIKVGNHWQVAFHHVALYRFEGDKKKGQAKGQNVETAWFAVLKSGIPATAPGAPVATTTPTTQAPTSTTQAPHAVTTTPPATQTPATQAPATVTTSPPTTSPPPTTTPTTSPPTTTPTTTGGGGYGY